MGLLIVYMQRRKLSLCTFEVAVDDMFSGLPPRALSPEEVILHAVPDGAGMIYPVVTAGKQVLRRDLEDIATTMNSILSAFEEELYMTPMQLLKVVSLLPGRVECQEDVSKFVLPDPEAISKARDAICTEAEAKAVISQHEELQSISNALVAKKAAQEKAIVSSQALEDALAMYREHVQSNRSLNAERKRRDPLPPAGEFSARAIASVRASFKKLTNDCNAMIARLRILRETIADLTLLVEDVLHGNDEVTASPTSEALSGLPCSTIEDLASLEENISDPEVKARLERAFVFATQGAPIAAFHKKALRAIISDDIRAHLYVEAVHGYPCPYDQAKRGHFPPGILLAYERLCSEKLPKEIAMSQRHEFWFGIFTALESNFRKMKKLKRAAEATE